MKVCNKCGYKHFDFEECPETFWAIREDERGCSWDRIGARDYEQAAAKYMEREYERRGEFEEVLKNVLVANADKTEIKKFNVYAEHIIDYSAEEVIE